MTPPRHSVDFRPNPDRAIYLTGTIDQLSVDRLTSSIIRLLTSGREPITLYIDSPGGNTFHAGMLLNLLTSIDQNFSPRCRLITVATGFAASAASDLLMAGDYALAYPHSMILCHGVRQAANADMLTHEGAVGLAKNLASTNEQFALELARNSISRFIFRIVFQRSESKIQTGHEQGYAPLNLEGFIDTLQSQSRISFELIKLLRNALTRSKDSEQLDLYVSNSLSQLGNFADMRMALFESHLLKAILDYELEHHSDESWSFRTDGFGKIEEKFHLLIDRHVSQHDDMVGSLCDRWGEFFLTKEEEEELALKPEESRSEWLLNTVQQRLKPIWFFFVSICRLLQEDDYYLSAEEGYWLGLVDEIIGRSDLPCPRIFVEYPATPNIEA